MKGLKCMLGCGSKGRYFRGGALLSPEIGNRIKRIGARGAQAAASNA
jgi:hypothetical protein